MKKLLLLLAATVVSLNAVVAAHWPSTLIIKTTKEDVIKVAVDEMEFSPAASQVAIKNLKKGKHYVRVVKVNNPLNPFKPKNELLFEGYVKIKRKREVLAVIDSHHRMMIVRNEKARKGLPYYSTGAEGSQNHINLNVNFGALIPKIAGLF